MTCCIVGFLILAAVGRVRRALGRGPATPMIFAPVAARPAPGQIPLPASEPAAAVVVAEAASPVLGYCAAGIGLCLLGAPLLVLSGAVENTGALWVWLLRSVIYLAVVLAVLRFGSAMPALPAPRGAGTLLIVAGAVVFELGVLDMHVFRLFEPATLLGDLAFHNIGPALAITGAAVLLYGSLGRSITSRRSSRSTVTSARPVSSAVTVSSTPPVTT